MEKLVQACIVALAVLLPLLFLYAAVRRMRYPFEVEWIESGMLVSVLRIAHGQGLYVAPTLDFVPFLYAPLYLYISAAMERLTGGGYFALRLLSTVATLGGCATIYALVRCETERRLAALAGAALYAGCYAIAGGFFDIGRVDSLFVCLVLLALLAQRRQHPVVAALVWVLAFQTKQTALPLAVLVLLAEWPRPRRMAAALATLLGVAWLSVLLLDHATGGWYSFYLFHLSGALPIVGRQVALFLPVMVVQPLAIAWVVIAAALLLAPLRGRAAMLPALTSFALVGGTWFVEAHRGASANAMMPLYAWVAVLSGVAMARLLDKAESAEGAPRLALMVLAAVALQLLALVYNPGRFVPPAAAVTDTERFIRQLSTVPGDVYVLNHSYDAVLAGKQPHAEGEALGAVLDGKSPTGEALRAELDRALADHRYTAVVVDNLETTGAGWHFERQYPLEVSTGLAGYRYLTSQPQWFALPCSAAPALVEGLLRPDVQVAPENCQLRAE
jgi:hypothetical protein